MQTNPAMKFWRVEGGEVVISAANTPYNDGYNHSRWNRDELVAMLSAVLHAKGEDFAYSERPKEPSTEILDTYYLEDGGLVKIEPPKEPG